MLSLLRGAIFKGAKRARLLSGSGRFNFPRNVSIILPHGFNTQKFVFVASRRLRPGPGVWTGQFLLKIVLTGAAEPAPGRPRAWTGQFLLRIVLAGTAEPAPGRPGGWTVHFLLRILLAGAPEVAPAGLGPGMVSFHYESYKQEHHKWPRPAWGP